MGTAEGNMELDLKQQRGSGALVSELDSDYLVVVKPICFSGSSLPCYKTGMLQAVCLPRGQFISLCTDCRKCHIGL